MAVTGSSIMNEAMVMMGQEVALLGQCGVHFPHGEVHRVDELQVNAVQHSREVYV